MNNSFCRCYPEFSKGPCEPGQFLERVSGRDTEVAVRIADRGQESERRPHHHLPRGSQVRCRIMERCDNGWVFWPSEGKCFQLYTQGPCHKVRDMELIFTAMRLAIDLHKTPEDISTI